MLGALFNSAIEHWLLELDSGLKRSEHGFVGYYRRLESGRRQLRHGWTRIQLGSYREGGGSGLLVSVSDSGRGLPLLKSICGGSNGSREAAKCVRYSAGTRRKRPAVSRQRRLPECNRGPIANKYHTICATAGIMPLTFSSIACSRGFRRHRHYVSDCMFTPRFTTAAALL